MGIAHNLTSLYTPQTNPVERANKMPNTLVLFQKLVMLLGFERDTANIFFINIIKRKEEKNCEQKHLLNKWTKSNDKPTKHINLYVSNNFRMYIVVCSKRKYVAILNMQMPYIRPPTVTWVKDNAQNWIGHIVPK